MRETQARGADRSKGEALLPANAEGGAVVDSELDEALQELRDRSLVGLSEEKVEELVGWLSDEYYDVVEGSERAELEEYWQTWRRMSQARPAQKTKNDPWENASNVTTPFMFSNINGVATHVKAALTEKSPRISVSCLGQKYKAHAKSVENLLNTMVESPLHMNWANYDDPIAYDTARMGTQFVETPWEERRIQLKRRTAGDTYEVVDVTTYAGPGTRLYRLEDVIIRPEQDDVQMAPAVQFRNWMTRQDIQRLEYDGFFENVDEVLGGGIDEIEDSRTDEFGTLGLDASGVVGKDSPSSLYEIMKAYARFDGDEDGLVEDLIVWYEPESKVVLRLELNELGHRPIAVYRHIKWPQNVYGGGVGWMLQPIQDEIDTLHNMRVDNLHISSLQMFATPIGSGLGPNESLFPLKQWPLDNPNDFKVIQFPNNAAETMSAEQMAQQYGRTVTGVSESQLGMPDTTAKSGTSPTLQNLLVQQGNKVLRSIIKNAESAQSEQALHVFLQLVANSDQVLQRGDLLELVDESDAENIREVLAMGVEDIPSRFRFSVRATPVDETEDAKRQMLMVKQQMFTMYTQQSMQLQQVLANPQLPTEMREFVTQLYVGQTKLMEEALRLYNVEDVRDYLPAIRMQELMLQLAEAQRSGQIEQLEQMLRRGNGLGNGSQGIGGVGGPGELGGVGPAAAMAPGQRGGVPQPAPSPTQGPAGGPGVGGLPNGPRY